MAALTVVHGCSNVFKQVSRYLPGNSLILDLTTTNGLKRFNSLSIQQVCNKHQKIRFKDPKVAKEKSYVFQRKKSPLKKLIERKDTPEFLARKPSDNIWIRKYYPQQLDTLKAAVAKHKEYADPMMLNNINGLIYADMQLNMKTKKKTKFLPNVNSTVLYPNTFAAGPTPRCLVLSDKIEDIDQALAEGAVYAGGNELIMQLKEEAITRSMYDHVICTPNIFPDLMNIRHLFKEKFPNQKRGTLGHDVGAMVKHFLSAVSYESKKIYEDVASLQVPFGQLDMDENHLFENFQKLVDKLCKGRNEKLGPFIKRIDIIAPPSPEKFQLAAELYVPGYDVPIEQDDEILQDEEEEEEEDKKKNSLKS